MYLHIPTALGSIVAALLISQATPASAATYVFEAQGTYTYDFDANDAYYYSQDPGERDETVTKTGTVILEVRGEDRNNDKKLTSKTSPTATGHELTWFSIKFEDENGASHWPRLFLLQMFLIKRPVRPDPAVSRRPGLRSADHPSFLRCGPGPV